MSGRFEIRYLQTAEKDLRKGCSAAAGHHQSVKSHHLPDFMIHKKGWQMRI